MNPALALASRSDYKIAAKRTKSAVADWDGSHATPTSQAKSVKQAYFIVFVFSNLGANIMSNQNQIQNQVQNQAIAQTCNPLLPATTQNYQAIESLPSTTPIDMPTTTPAIAYNSTMQLILIFIVLIRSSNALVQSCTILTRTIRDRPSNKN
jgi:hypothetical protein